MSLDRAVDVANIQKRVKYSRPNKTPREDLGSDRCFFFFVRRVSQRVGTILANKSTVRDLQLFPVEFKCESVRAFYYNVLVKNIRKRNVFVILRARKPAISSLTYETKIVIRLFAVPPLKRSRRLAVVRRTCSHTSHACILQCLFGISCRNPSKSFNFF